MIVFGQLFSLPKISSSRGSVAEVRVCVQDDNHDKESIEGQANIEKISSEKSVNSRETEVTPEKKRSISLNRFILLQVCLTRRRFITNFFGRLTM